MISGRVVFRMGCTQEQLEIIKAITGEITTQELDAALVDNPRTSLLDIYLKKAQRQAIDRVRLNDRIAA